MSCECENLNVTTHESCILCYAGGPATVYFQLIKKTLAQCEPGECGMPVVHDNGDVEYPAGNPPAILGYEQDAENRRLFHPKWPVCRWRLLSVSYPNGCLCLKSDCANPSGKSPPTLEDCLACTAR